MTGFINIEVEFENLEQFLKNLRRYPKVLNEAAHDLLSSAGPLMQERLKKYIAEENDWKPLHPLSLKYASRRSGGASRITRRNKKDKRPLIYLEKFAGFVTRDKELEVNLTDNPFVELLVKRAGGETIPVNEKRRRLFGATRNSAEDVAGRDFFPVRSATTSLRIPKREIFETYLKKNEGVALLYFKRNLDNKINAAAAKNLDFTGMEE